VPVRFARRRCVTALSLSNSLTPSHWQAQAEATTIERRPRCLAHSTSFLLEPCTTAPAACAGPFVLRGPIRRLLLALRRVLLALQHRCTPNRAPLNLRDVLRHDTRAARPPSSLRR